MSAEQGPQDDDYQFKHHKQVFLDEYRGVASDLMELNHPITDGFMQVGDIRKDIVIVQQPQERVRDYDQIGNVRVAKFLHLPSMNKRGEDSFARVRNEEEAWYLAINDQELAQNVASSNNGRKFDEAYIDAFQKEVVGGMKDILKKEKLLNSGQYNLSFYLSYYTFLTKDFVLYPTLAVTDIMNSSNMSEVAGSSIRVATLFTISHVFINALNVMRARTPFRHEFNPSMLDVNYEDPFIRHSIPEFVLPPVPVDRLVRGMKYLQEHKEEFIHDGRENKIASE